MQVTSVMKVDVNELAFIKKNTPNGMYSIVADRLRAKGHKTTRFAVANEVTAIKDDYKEEIIEEVREVFTLLTGLSFQNPAE